MDENSGARQSGLGREPFLIGAIQKEDLAKEIGVSRINTALYPIPELLASNQSENGSLNLTACLFKKRSNLPIMSRVQERRMADSRDSSGTPSTLTSSRRTNTSNRSRRAFHPQAQRPLKYWAVPFFALLVLTCGAFFWIRNQETSLDDRPQVQRGSVKRRLPLFMPTRIDQLSPHPRLLLSANDFVAMRDRVKTDSFVKSGMENLETYAVSLLSTPPHKYELVNGEMLLGSARCPEAHNHFSRILPIFRGSTIRGSRRSRVDVCREIS